MKVTVFSSAIFCLFNALISTSSLASVSNSVYICKGEHYLETTLFGGKIQGNCVSEVENKQVEIIFDIETYGLGFGASTHSTRELQLQISDSVINRLMHDQSVKLRVCKGKSFEIGWLGGVNYSKICAMETDQSTEIVCLKFSGGLLFSGGGAEWGANCNHFDLHLNQ